MLGGFMTSANLSEYKSIYLQTAKEYINSMISSYAKLLANSVDHESINMIHISSHSLRSQSQVMGFVDIANLCDEIEKLSMNILDGIAKADDKFMHLLKNSVAELNLEIAKIEKEDAEIHSASSGS
jgi:chemotaxis protein histidine kinase CheA